MGVLHTLMTLVDFGYCTASRGHQQQRSPLNVIDNCRDLDRIGRLVADALWGKHTPQPNVSELLDMRHDKCAAPAAPDTTTSIVILIHTRTININST